MSFMSLLQRVDVSLFKGKSFCFTLYDLHLFKCSISAHYRVVFNSVMPVNENQPWVGVLQVE